VQGGQCIANAILSQIVTGGHLAAETIPAIGTRQLAHIIGGSLHQHGHTQVSKTHSIGNALLLPKIRERYENTINLSGVRLEKRRALQGILKGHDRSEQRIFWSQSDGINAFFFQNTQDLSPSGDTEMIREKTAIANNDTQSRLTHRLLLYH